MELSHTVHWQAHCTAICWAGRAIAPVEIFKNLLKAPKTFLVVR